MDRRDFLGGLVRTLGAGTALSFLSTNQLGAVTSPRTWRHAHTAHGAKNTRNSARNLVFLLLDGGASHVDTFDLKLHRSTPTSLGAENIGGLLWPSGIMPKLSKLTDRFSLVRSLTAIEAVHERAIYHLTTGHRQDASRIDEIPHLASVMSFKLADQRRAGDTLPTAVRFGFTLADNGFFPIEDRGLTLDERGQMENLQHFIEQPEARFGMLNDLLAELPDGENARAQRIRVQRQAQRLMNDRELHALLGAVNEEEFETDDENYSSVFRAQAEAVVRLLDADKGTRVIQMALGGWDHHDNIYGQGALPELAGALDEGLAHLITGLEAKPAKFGTGTLLDETLIVVAGEFGRTTGDLNGSAGRDHYPYAMSALFAGGGVRPGRVIGSTSAVGDYVLDQGWSHNRLMGIGDLLATLYSAVGIDWTESFTDTPSGRLYEIVPTVRTGQLYEIDGLFA